MKKGNFTSNSTQNGTLVGATTERMKEQTNHIEDKHAVAGKKVKLVCSTTVPIKLMKLPTATDDSDVYIIKPALSTNSRRSTSAASFITVPILNRKSKDNGKSHTNIDCSDDLNEETVKGIENCRSQAVSKCKQNGYVIMAYKKGAEKKEDAISSVGKRIHESSTCLASATSSSTVSSSKSTEPQGLIHDISKPIVHSQATIMSRSHDLPVTSDRIKRNKDYRQNTAMGVKIVPHAQQNNRAPTQKTMSLAVSSASKVNQPCDMKTGYVTSQKRMEGSRQEQREDIESNHDAVDGNCASDMLLMNGTANEEQTMSKSEDRKQMSSTVSDLITEKSAGVTTISTDDLAKLLKQYNLTLKAVPFDCREDEIERSRSLGKEVKSIKNNRKGGQVYITSVKNASKFRTAFGTSDLTKTNILEEPGRSSTLSLLDYDKTEGKSGSERPLRVQVRLLREGNISSSSTVSKTTPQGTFSNWRIDCKKSSTFCAKKETRSRSKRTRETGKTRRASTQGASKKPTIVKIPSDTKRPEEYGFRSLSYKNFQSFNENNNIKVQDVVYCQHRTTPLYHAFLDLEARDQAARETVRSLENTQHINSDPSMAKTRTCELCPLFPTMRDLVVDNLVDADVDDATQADPVLTSAVAFPCQDTEYDYVGGDLESTYFPLSNTCAETSVLSNDGNKLLNQNHVQFSEDQSAIENSEKDSTEEEQVPTSNASNTFKILDNSYSSKNHSTLSHEYYGFPSNPAEEKLDSISTKISLPSVNEFQSTSDNAKTNEDNLICQSSANNYFCTQDGNRETRFAKPSLHLERNTRKTLSYRGDSESKKGCGEVAIHQNGNYRTSITHGQENSRYLQAFNRHCYAKRRRASSASDDCSCKRVIENDAVLKQRLRDAEKKSSDPHTEQRSSATDSVDYFKFTSPRNWNSKQVAAWFRDTAEKYHKDKRISQRSKNGVLKTTRKRKLTANNNHSTEYEKLVPSTVNSLSGQTLCQFTVDDLVDIGLDRDFALYATEVVHTTDDNCEDINSTARDNTMSNHNSYDIQSSLQSTPITSAEQLEESVNFDDLLGSDSIIGSLELLDVFESSTSFLKSLGQDYIVTRTSLPQPSTPSVSMHFHQPLPDFSTAHYHHHMQQNGLTNCTESGIMSTLNLYRNDMNLSLPYKSPYQYDTRMGFDRVVKQEENGIDSNQNFFENYQNIPTSVKCETSDQTFQYLQASSNTTQRTISPSTFYNVPNTSRGVIHNYHPSVSDQSYSSTSNKPKWEGMYSKPASTGYTSHRDSSMSDTDSGIHSPESTPNKNHCATCTLSNQANACGTVDGKNAGIIVQEQNKYTPMCPISEEGMICNEGVWSTAMGADMLTEQTSYVTPQDSNNEVFAFTKTGTDNIQCCEKKSDTNPMLEDLWERGSTSSTVSTLSLESEPKLLNMDDYKTYIATKPTNSDMAQQSSQSYHCNLQQTVDQVQKVSPTVRTLTGNVVFVPARENSTDNSIQIPLTKAIVETKQKRTKAVTNGQITTVYPAFMANIRRTNSLPSSPGDKSKPKASAVSQNKPLSADGSPKNHDVSPGQQLTVKTEFQSNDGLEPLYDDPFEGKMRRTPAGKSIHLWEFIRDTLLNPLYCPRLIKWEDRNSGIFRFVQSDIVAGMWGEKKNNPKMTYEKLSRAMRYYYNRGILERVDGRRLVYKFGKNAHGWQLTTTDTHTDVKTTGTLKKEKSTNRRVSTFQTVKSPKLSVTSSKRSSKYQISVSHSCGDEKNYIPSRKRRRLSEPEVTKDISLVSTDQKSAGTQTSPSPSTEAANKVRVKKADESMEFGSDSDRRQSSSCDDVTECVVFVASTEPITTTQPKQCESNDKREHAVESEECWSPVSSPDRNSKLPSADVLLGKHYKIATVAI